MSALCDRNCSLSLESEDAKYDSRYDDKCFTKTRTANKMDNGT